MFQYDSSIICNLLYSNYQQSMHRANSSSNRSSNKCPFCSKQFYLLDTLQSHKQQCILGKSLKKPPLTRQSSAVKQPESSKNIGEQTRFQSKDKFRIKKLGNTGLLNITSGDWKGRDVSELISTSKTGFSTKTSQSSMLRNVEDSSVSIEEKRETKQKKQAESKKESASSKLDLSTKQKLFYAIKNLPSPPSDSQFQQISSALVALEYPWPINIQLYVSQIEQIQDSTSQIDKSSKSIQKLLILRNQAILKIKQFITQLIQKQKHPIMQSSRSINTSTVSKKPRSNIIENYQYCFCTKCIGELRFGEEIVELECEHKYHRECWDEDETMCLGCQI